MKFILEDTTGVQFILVDSTGETTPESLGIQTALFVLGSPGQNFLLIGSDIDDNVNLVPLGYFTSGVKRLFTDVNVLTDDLKIRLLTSGYTPNINHTVISDTDAHLAANADDTLIESKDWSVIGDYSALSFTPIAYQAVGEVNCSYWVIYDDTLVDKPLICYGTFDTETPISLTIVDDSTINFVCSAVGLFGVLE